MGHCKDCKWWAPNHNPKDRPAIARAYYCKNPSLNTAVFEIQSDYPDCASTNDGVSIITGPEFGCVHWEQA